MAPSMKKSDKTGERRNDGGRELGACKKKKKKKKPDPKNQMTKIQKKKKKKKKKKERIKIQKEKGKRKNAGMKAGCITGADIFRAAVWPVE